MWCVLTWCLNPRCFCSKSWFETPMSCDWGDAKYQGVSQALQNWHICRICVLLTTLGANRTITNSLMSSALTYLYSVRFFLYSVCVYFPIPFPSFSNLTEIILKKTLYMYKKSDILAWCLLLMLIFNDQTTQIYSHKSKAVKNSFKNVSYNITMIVLF